MSEASVHNNVKHQGKHAVWAVLTWVVLYFGPGLAVGLYVNEWAGLAIMVAGAALFAIFQWRCFYPKRLIADRDGVRLECARGKCPDLGYEKIHEARWEKAPETWRKVFGPLVFAEPLWFAQCRGDMCLVIVHAGSPIVLRSDEFERLEELVEFLRKRNVAGLAGASNRTAQRVFGKDK